MATKKISELEAINAAEDNDVLVIVDTSESTTNKITKGNLLIGAGHTIEMTLNENYQIVLVLKNAAGTALSTQTIDLPNENAITNLAYNNGILTVTKQSGATSQINLTGLIEGLVTESDFNTFKEALQATLEAINEKDAEQDEAISENYKVINKLNEKLENQQKVIDQLPQVEGQGTSITLENTIEAQFTIFDIEGNSTQETTEGYQLFDIGKSASDYSSNVGNSLVITEKSIQMKVLPSGQTITYRTQNLTGNKKYTITGNASLVYSRLYIRMRKNDDSGWLTNSDASIEGWTYNSYYQGWYKENEPKAINQTVTIPECKYWQLGFGFNSLETAVNTTQTISDIMLNEGSTAQPWEKYTNGASPNPNYEQPIESAGDNENLCPTKEFTSLSRIRIVSNETEYGAIVQGIAVGAGTYMASFDVTTLPTSDYRIQFIASSDSTQSQSAVDITNPIDTITKTCNQLGNYFVSITVAQNCYLYLRCVPAGFTLDSIKIQQGNKASGYSPYGMGSINEKIINGNIFDEIMEQGAYSGSDGTTLISSPKYIRSKNYTNVVAGETYIITIKAKGTNQTNGNIFIYNIDETLISTISGLLNSFTIPTGGRKIKINVFNNNNIAPSDVEFAMMNIGSIATPYVPHKEQDYPIFVQQPFRSIGDVRDCFVKKSDGWYERHYITQLGLDGTENWSRSDTTGFMRYVITLANMKSVGSARSTDILCNIFKPSTENGYNNCFAFNNTVAFYVPENIEDFEGFKELLQEKNAKLQYELAEPLDLPCTETQIQQLENKPSTYKDFTIINSEDETPAYLEVSGIRDINTMFDKVTNAIVSLGGNV